MTRLSPCRASRHRVCTLSYTPSPRLSPCQVSRRYVCHPVRRPVTVSVAPSGVPSPRLSPCQASRHRVCQPIKCPITASVTRQASRHCVYHPVRRPVTASVTLSDIPSPRLSPRQASRHRVCHPAGHSVTVPVACQASRHRVCHPVGHAVTAPVTPSGIPSPRLSPHQVCLDRRDASGHIGAYQDPLLYRCSLECRLTRSVRPRLTRLSVLCGQLELSLTDVQAPMFARLIQLAVAVYYGTLPTPAATAAATDETAPSGSTLAHIACDCVVL